MSRDEWEQAIARALIEGTFRARLLADPVEALADYGLRASQQGAVAEVRASSLPEFAARFMRAAATWGWSLESFAHDNEAR